MSGLFGGGLSAETIGLLSQSSTTSLTAETALYTLPIPAGFMRPNDILTIRPIWRFTGAGGTRTVRVKLGATLAGSATIWVGALASNQLSSAPYVEIRGRNSLTSQIGTWSTSSGFGSANGYGGSSTDVSVFAVDFSLAQNLYITGQVAVGTDVVDLAHALVTRTRAPVP